MNNRINYIDRMKGMAIFLVVMGHVYFFGFGQSDSIVFKAIGSFHMPLFMFLSGLVACSGIVPPYWNFAKLGKKLKGLLLPLVVFGICFSLTFSGDTLSCIKGFAESPNKNGYWYLMTLAVFYASQSLFRINTKQKWQADIALAAAIWGGYIILWKTTAQTNDYFCLLNCANFYPFFILGVFATKYRLLEKLRHANWLYSLCAAAYLALFCASMPIHALDSLSRHLLMPLCMVVVIVFLFMSRESETSRIERILEYTGKRTLDVYVIHYFLITHIHLETMDRWLESTGNVVLSVAASFALSIVVTAMSIGIGNMLHKGRWIEKVAFGLWRPKKPC